MASPTPADASASPATSDLCNDLRTAALISALKSALLESDGTLLASLVSPAHGMDVRLYRNGRVVNYAQGRAVFLFDSTYQEDWGAAPGSGLETTGSFRDLVVPALLDVLTRDYSLACNRLKVGGTTYRAEWPYPQIAFYSAYWPGTPVYDGLDWRTVLLGMHYVAGRPYLYAIVPLQWEP